MAKKKVELNIVEHHRVKPGECPVCGHEIDAATGVEGPDAPTENDVTVCFYCATVMLFNKDLTTRVISEQELTELMENNPDVWETVQKIILFVNQKHD